MSKFPPVESEDLGFEPLKAAAFVALANFPFASCAFERLRPTFASPSSNSGDFHRLAHLFHSPTFKNRKSWHAPGDVKLLLPPCRAEESPTWNGPNAPGMEWSANGATSLLSIDKSAPMPVKRRPEALIASVDGSFRVASETEAPAARRLAPIIPPSAPGPIISVFKRFPGPHSLTHA